MSPLSIPQRRFGWRPNESMLGYGAGHLFFVRGGTLMAHRVDEAGSKLVGEAIRVADDVENGPLSAGFSVSNNGTIVHWPGALVLSQPTWVSRTGTVLGTVGPPAAYEGVALSPDASEVAVDRFDAEPAVLRLDMRGAITTVASGTALSINAHLAPGRQRPRLHGGDRHAAESVLQALRSRGARHAFVLRSHAVFSTGLLP